MALREPEYRQNMAFLRREGIGDNMKLKLTYMPVARNSGVDVPRKEKSSTDEKRNKESAVRMENSISRSKRLIHEYAFNNEWDFFFTGTFDKEKIDRYDLQKIHDSITHWLRNQNQKYKCNIEFLLVPELHKDGAVHLHGLLRGIPKKCLHRFKIGETMGKMIANKVKKGESVFTWIDYSLKYGFCDLEPIKNHEAVSRYIEKYITKDLMQAVPAGKQCFWHSRELNLSELVCKGQMNRPAPFEWDYEGEHAKVKTFPYDEIMLDSLLCLID